MNIASIETAIQFLQAGKFIILVDDADRENEGDLVMAGEFATPEAINFMAKHARGLICMPMSANEFDRLAIPMMVQDNRSKNNTAFGVSIGSATGITTGISASDRAHTVRVVARKEATRDDIVMPGHIFPLRAVEKGLAEREGHTEGSVELMKLAGLHPVSVICEVMNSDGTMARLPNLIEFAEKYNLPIVTIKDLSAYAREKSEGLEKVSSSYLPIQEIGQFHIHTFRSRKDGVEHIALVHPPLNRDKAPLVRLHSECLTGDVFRSLRCDCGRQLNTSLSKIAAEGGVLLYLRQHEGRGIGLGNKIKAYALQDCGYDTVEANHQLGFAADQRDYRVAAEMLKHLGLSQVRLLTNNPKKIASLEDLGVKVIARESLEVEPTKENIRYLSTKREKMGHLLNLVGSEEK